VRLGLGIAAGPDPETLAPLATEAEGLGYDSIWSNDSPAGDGLAQLASWAHVSTHVQLGVGVLALDRHRPEDIAARVRELGLPLGRLIIGLGAGFTRTPLEVVRAGVAELRRHLPEARLAVAAMGPKMCELGGEVGDAVLLNWMTPERAVWARQKVEAGSARAGKQPDDVTIFGYVRTALGADAGERLQREVSMYLQMPAYARHFQNMGADPESVGVTATTSASVAGALNQYSVMDEPVARVLSHRTVADVMAVARAAIGA
jgi:alkanesulfonate monooxygenase SsuD/methylene tetrahydromethanopterin reductase-like flavin-dependent oxidoreductase (luciferase family)